MLDQPRDRQCVPHACPAASGRGQARSCPGAMASEHDALQLTGDGADAARGGRQHQPAHPSAARRSPAAGRRHRRGRTPGRRPAPRRPRRARRRETGQQSRPGRAVRGAGLAPTPGASMLMTCRPRMAAVNGSQLSSGRVSPLSRSSGSPLPCTRTRSGNPPTSTVRKPVGPPRDTATRHARVRT